MDFKVIVTINEKNRDLYNSWFAKAYQALPADQIAEEARNNEGRFLTLNHYLAHAKRLLAIDPAFLMLPFDEDTFDINAESRQIKAQKIVILQNDNTAETIQFTVDRYFDQMDLNEARIFVQWTLPSGKTGATWADEMKDLSIPGKIRFGWTLTSDVTEEVGIVKYSVRFWNKKINEKNNIEEVVYSLNTLTSSLTISPSLQPSINQDVEIVAPTGSGLFEKAVRNSQISSTGNALPLAPYFHEPGTNLPLTASLVNDTLTLKAQAIVGDEGIINYKWYYKPAVTITLEDIGATYSNEVFYPFEDITDEDGNVFYGFKHFGGTCEDVYELFEGEKLTFGDQYYYVNGEGKYVAYDKTVVTETPIYEKYTTYTVPIINKVTGQYKVCATNYIKPNTTMEYASNICQLVSPDNIVITADLPEKKVIDSEKETTFEIKVNKQTSDDAIVIYKLEKSVTNAAEGFTDVQTNDKDGSFKISTPGWYRIHPTVNLNREDKENFSTVCKITYEPDIPVIVFGEESSKQEDDNDTAVGVGKTYSVAPDAVVLLDVKCEPFTKVNSNDSLDLYSEMLIYEWTVQEGHDSESRILTESDIGVLIKEADLEKGSGLGTEKIEIINVGKYVYGCTVKNVLNGVTSVASNRLTFEFT